MIELSVGELIKTIYNNVQFYSDIKSELFSKFLELKALISNYSCNCSTSSIPEDSKTLFKLIETKEPEVYAEIMSISGALYDNQEIKLIG